MRRIVTSTACCVRPDACPTADPAVLVCLSAAQQQQQQSLETRTEGSVTAEDVVAWLSTSITVVRSNDVSGGLGAAAVNAALHQSHALVHRLMGDAELPPSGNTTALPP